MKINQFKKGDFVQRTKPTQRFGDHSYVGDCLLFLGCEKKIIFVYLPEDPIIKDVVTLDEFGWGDDNWDYFPKTTLDKLKKEFQVFNNLKNND